MGQRFDAARPLRWGIIGCGNVTELKSGPAFNKVEGSRLVAVMRRDAAKAEDYARRHGVPSWTTDADALIKDPEVDAVYIATPPGSHRDYALQVARAGKPCCVEKPMALNAPQCIEMINAFEAAGQPLFVAYYRRSLPRFQQLKRWMNDGAIGELRHVHWSFSRKPSPQDRAGPGTSGGHWHTDPAISGGGYFVDLACHGLDLMIHLLGPIVRVAGIAANQQDLYAAEDAVAGSWQFASGATGSGYWNFGSHEREDQLVIRGSRGKIQCAVFDNLPLVLHSAGQGEDAAIQVQSALIAHPENIQLCHIDNIIKHLNGELTHPSLGKDALQASWVMDQMLSSFKRQGRQRP
jgi:1,5-anhydro-D-fructose reductase (1,5-anhydro-D-mannitol-forming)